MGKPGLKPGRRPHEELFATRYRDDGRNLFTPAIAVGYFFTPAVASVNPAVSNLHSFYGFGRLDYERDNRKRAGHDDRHCGRYHRGRGLFLVQRRAGIIGFSRNCDRIYYFIPIKTLFSEDLRIKYIKIIFHSSCPQNLILDGIYWIYRIIYLNPIRQAFVLLNFKVTCRIQVKTIPNRAIIQSTTHETIYNLQEIKNPVNPVNPVHKTLL
jgi:hypothetical protein